MPRRKRMSRAEGGGFAPENTIPNSAPKLPQLALALLAPSSSPLPASPLNQHLLQLRQRPRQHHPHRAVGLAQLLGDLLRRQAHQVPQPQRFALVSGQQCRAPPASPVAAGRARTRRWASSCWRPAGCPDRRPSRCRRGSTPRATASRFWLSKCRRWASMIFRSQTWNSQCSGSQLSSGALSSERIASRHASCRMSSASTFFARWAPMRACRNPISAGPVGFDELGQRRFVAGSKPGEQLSYHGWRRRNSSAARSVSKLRNQRACVRPLRRCPTSESHSSSVSGPSQSAATPAASRRGS